MEKDFEQLASQAKRITLRPEEKQKMRAGILQFMDAHPAVRLNRTERRVYWSQLLTFRPLQTMTLILILALLSGGGISLAAEGTMPGDTLYLMKVEVNERIRGWAALTSEADAEWGTRRTERRLEEVEKLAAEGKLDAKLSVEIETRLAAHTKEAADQIAALRNNNKIEAAADASSRFETSLSAHQRILERVAVEHAGAETNMQVILNNVRAAANTVAQVRSNTEVELLNISEDSDAAVNARLRVSAESRQKIAETTLASVRAYLDSTTSLDEEAKIKAAAQVKVAENVLSEGKTQFENKVYGKAFAAFQKSVRIAQEARLLVRARQTLKISVDIGQADDEDTAASAAMMMSADSSTSTNATSSPADSTLKKGSSTNTNASTTIHIGL